MPEYWITYETPARLTYRVTAGDQEEARRIWRDEAPFDLDQYDFAKGAVKTETLTLLRLEMLHPARNVEVNEVGTVAGA